MGVLDQMTAGITQRKAEKAGATLTPVGVEANGTKPSLASLPNDLPGRFMAAEELGEAARTLREKAQLLLDTATAIDALIAETAQRKTKGDDKQAAEDATKAAERAADEADRERKAKAGKKKTKVEESPEEFNDRMKRLQAEAQASVFTSSDAEPKEQAAPASTTSGGWTCPEHGDEDIEELTSRLRPDGYLACAVAGCGEFEPKES